MKAELKPRINFEGRTALQEVIPLSTPFLVFLDPSDKCNGRCSWCPSSNKKLLKAVGRGPQTMPFTLYKKIIHGFCEFPEPIKTLRLYKDGEPYLNSRFADMVGYARDSGGFGQVDTTTNGLAFTHSMIRDSIDAGLDQITISVPLNYSQGYVDKIKYFHDYSTGRCKMFVKIVGPSIGMEKTDKFFLDFGDHCDRIFVENLAPCWPGYEILPSSIGIYGQEVIEPVTVCPYIFYSISINSDGRVSLCFLDWRHDTILGDLRNTSIKDIWNGAKLETIRKTHLRGERQIMKHCCECGQLSHGAPDNIDQYAKYILGKL
jgi:radical SAM protein with 4Fe4S-binding SPASM domain